MWWSLAEGESHAERSNHRAGDPVQDSPRLVLLEPLAQDAGEPDQESQPGSGLASGFHELAGDTGL